MAAGSRDPRIQGQGRPGEVTSHLRLRAVTLRSHPEPEAKGGSWEETPCARGQGWRWGGASQGAVAAQVQEGLEELSHVEGQEQWR